MHDEIMDDESESFSGDRSVRLRELLGRVEKTYLELLRVSALVVATLVLIWIVWLTLSSAYNISRNPDAVEVEQVVLSADEIVDIDLSEPAPAVSSDSDNQAAPSAFEKFRDDYFSIYKNDFETFRQDDDPELSKEQFTETFLAGLALDPEDWDLAAEEFELPLEGYVEASDYPRIVEVMRKAATLPVTENRLEKYRSTPKVRKENQVRRTRTERYCTYFSSYFNQCYSYGSRSVPYTETVVTMVPPDGVVSPQTLFAAYHENYLAKLIDRRRANSSEAALEREERAAANVKGWLDLGNALWFAGLFLALMFFFLLIAIERHQRKLANEQP